MRDAVVVGLFLVLIVLSLRKPIGGLVVWIWTALITPNYFLFGFGVSVRFNLIAALVTILGYVMSPKKNKIVPNALITLTTVFFFWTLITSIFAIHNSPLIEHEINVFVRVIILFFFCLLIAAGRRDFNMLCLAISLSLGFFGLVEGLKFIVSGGGHNIFGPRNSNLFDNNHLALAVNMTIPIILYLHSEFKSKNVRLFILGVAAVTTLMVVGTFSRGGFVGLLILGLFLFLSSKKKLIFTLAIFVIGSVVLTAIPDRYYERIDTINNATEDNSFLGRVVAWKQTILIALDNPITGGGFYAVQDATVWYSYAMDFDRESLISTPHPNDTGVKAAHSIYFQVLGDHGFIGLFLYLSILLTAILKSRRLMLAKNLSPEIEWVGRAGRACFISLIIFSVCGALLSMAYFELLFLLVALVCIIDRAHSNSKLVSTEKMS